MFAAPLSAAAFFGSRLQHAIVGRQRLGVVAPFGVSLGERQMRRKQLGVALDGGSKGNQRGVGLFEAVAREAEKEEDLAIRRRLVCLLKQARGSSIITPVKSALGLIQDLAPGKRGNQSERQYPKTHCREKPLRSQRSDELQ